MIDNNVIVACSEVPLTRLKTKIAQLTSLRQTADCYMRLQ